ncbi:hypothetical protein Ancab_019266 [Ancistrocladus abbreviatus]
MGGSGGGDDSASSKLSSFLRKIIFLPCWSSSSSSRLVDPAASTAATTCPSYMDSEMSEMSSPPRQGENFSFLEMAEEGESAANLPSKCNASILAGITAISLINLCAICLEPLINNNGPASPGKAVFTSQCCHAFHLACISSNIRHGNLTCPICRAHWTRLPHTLYPPCFRKQDDPILRILDDSISTFRVHRRSFLRSARYDDDDPIEPEAHSVCQTRLCFTLTPLPVPQSHPSSNFCSCMHYPSAQRAEPFSCHSHGIELHHQCYNSKSAAYLSVSLAQQPAIDLVLVASPNGPHLRLLKQCMALVVFALRPIDRLAIVSYSSAAARIFPLRRMTAYGKRAALQVIDRLFYAGYADPMEGIKKGIKILKDRAHSNPGSSILCLSDNPNSSRSYRGTGDMSIEMPIPIHQFHVASTMSIMHELEEFLERLLGGEIREAQLRIGDPEEARIVRLGDLRGNDERRILLDMGNSCAHVCVGYSYVEGVLGGDEQVRTGEVLVRSDDSRETGDAAEAIASVGRASCADSWDYHDPCMARRWAKRLHGR